MPSLRQIAAFLTGAGGRSRGDEPGPRRDGEPAPPEAVPIEPSIAAEIEGPDPALMDSGALVRHIVARYHEVHRREIGELIRLARRVEATHADHPAAPLGLADLLARVRGEMDEHMKKEEEGIFPMFLDGHPDLGPAIDIMRDDHDAHGERLRRLEALTRNHTPPGDACEGWRALYAGTRKFAADLREHIGLENDVLFPRFAERA